MPDRTPATSTCTTMPAMKLTLGKGVRPRKTDKSPPKKPEQEIKLLYVENLLKNTDDLTGTREEGGGSRGSRRGRRDSRCATPPSAS